MTTDNGVRDRLQPLARMLKGAKSTIDLTPYLQGQTRSGGEEPLLSVAFTGRIALAMKGRFFLRCFCESFSENTRIGCAVTDEQSCLNYIQANRFDLLLCTDLLEKGNGFELARKARKHQSDLKVVMLALSDAIPVEHSNAPWLEAVVAEADIIEDRKPLEAAVMAVMGNHSYRSPSLRSDELPYLSCPRLTPREYEVLDRLARGMSDKEISEDLVVSEQTARTYTKRLLRTLEVNNRVQAVLKGMRCGMVQI